MLKYLGGKAWNNIIHLLQIEYVVVEIILQLFICIVDAELLKAIGLKVLKAKNVQDTNRQALENKSKKTDQPMRSKKVSKKILNIIILWCLVFIMLLIYL